MLSDKELDLLFRDKEMARFTPRTISSLTALKVNLALVRANGFAVNDEEQVAGVRAIAVPVIVIGLLLRHSQFGVQPFRFRAHGFQCWLAS